MSDPYLPETKTIQARPTKISKSRSMFYEHALPNEYIVEVGVKDAKPSLGGKFWKIGKEFLKFPAAVQTVYFTSDNANKNYQGLKIDGYACWRINPEAPEVAARSLDFSDQDNPMGNTNRILRTICTEAIRHIIANTTIDEALTKKDEIGRDLKAQLERIERTWGVIFDQVGIERVTILSATVFDDLQQKTRDSLRLAAADSRMATDQEIEKKRAHHTEETERLHRQTEKESRILKAQTESEIHKVELDEQARRNAEERREAEESRQAEQEAAERAEEQKAEQAKRQADRNADIRVREAEAETKAAQAMAQTLIAQAEVEHERALKELEMEAARTAIEMRQNSALEDERQAMEIKRAAERIEAEAVTARKRAETEHESEKLRLERFRIEEEIRNQQSEQRLTAEFMEKLPEVAAALKIDRYTVLDGSGASPLTQTVAQIMTLLDEVRPGRSEKKTKKKD